MLLNHDELKGYSTTELMDTIDCHISLKDEMTDASYDFQRSWNDEFIRSIQAELEYRKNEMTHQ